MPNAITEERASHIFATAPDVVGFSLYCSNNNITRFQSLSHYEEKLLIFSQQYQTDFLWAQGSFAAHFYRVELLARNSLLFDPSCRLNEDVIFSAKALFCSVRILLLDAYLYVYRRNPQSVTSTFHYSLHNAAEIPNAWASAANFFDNHPEITPEGLQKWHRFCMETSAVRCLEMLRCLAENRYDLNEAKALFAGKPYFSLIDHLSSQNLAEWQQPDLYLYQENPAAFFLHFSKIGKRRDFIKHLPGFPLLRKFWETKKYSLTWQDILAR